jgi:hypothetical protein
MPELKIIILSSLFCFGWEYITFCPQKHNQKLGFDGYEYPQGTPEALSFIRFLLGNAICKLFPKRKEVILKPLFHCVVCMSGWVTLMFYSLHLYITNEHICFKTISTWVVLTVAVAGLNSILDRFR